MPMCVWARALVCVVHAWRGAARHVGSHGWAAPGPVTVCWWAPGGGGGATFTLAASVSCALSCMDPVLSPAPGGRGQEGTSSYLSLPDNAHKPGSLLVVLLHS